MYYPYSNTILNQMDILKNVRISMITDYKNSSLLFDRLRDGMDDLNSYQNDAISFMEYTARLQLEYGFDMYYRKKSSMILDSIKTIDAVGLKEFFRDAAAMCSCDLGRESAESHSYECIEKYLMKVNSKESLLDFCEWYTGALLEGYKSNRRREKEMYSNDDTCFIDKHTERIVHDNYAYLDYIIDCKYDAYEFVYDKVEKLVEDADERLDTDNFIHKRKGENNYV